MEIFDIAKVLLTKEEIREFIKLRLSMIENQEKKTIGINTDTILYSKLLNENIKLNVICEAHLNNEGTMECLFGSLIFDDDNIYKYLINALQKYDNVYEAVYKAAIKYATGSILPKEEIKKIREHAYIYISGYSKKPFSIKLFHHTKLSMCTEIAGIAHNMFKFLGIDSDIVTTGIAIPNYHTYNIVYPEGRDNYAILCDIQSSDGDLPCMFYLDDKKRKDLYDNKTICVGVDDVIKTYKVLFNIDIISRGNTTEYIIPKDAEIETLVEYLNPELAKKLKYKK